MGGTKKCCQFATSTVQYSTLCDGIAVGTVYTEHNRRWKTLASHLDSFFTQNLKRSLSIMSIVHLMCIVGSFKDTDLVFFQRSPSLSSFVFTIVSAKVLDVI